MIPLTPSPDAPPSGSIAPTHPTETRTCRHVARSILERAIRSLVAIGLVTGGSVVVAGTINVCERPDGSRNYTDQPCAPGSRLSATADLTPLPPVGNERGLSREQALQREVEALRRELDQRDSRYSASPDIPPARPAAVATPANPRACRDARRSYELESASLLNDERAIRAKRSAMFIACGVPEPDETRIEINQQTNIDTRPAR